LASIERNRNSRSCFSSLLPLHLYSFRIPYTKALSATFSRYQGDSETRKALTSYFINRIESIFSVLEQNCHGLPNVLGELGRFL
jgi:hypothetical protein